MTNQGEIQRVICERLREFGYASERHLKLYGEEFDLVSDPIRDGDGFAIKGIARRSASARYIGIPLSIVHMLRQELTHETQPT